MYMKSDQ